MSKQDGWHPIHDVWILARPKVKYYGAFPNGFLERARILLGVGIEDSVLHVCGGRVRDYPGRRGFGPNDCTLDLDPELAPDFLQDARDPFPHLKAVGLGPNLTWRAVLIDRPYTPEDADQYAPGRSTLPQATSLVRNGLAVVQPGGRVGILDYIVPSPGSRDSAKLLAVVGVMAGYNNRMRAFTVFERPTPTDDAGGAPDA